MSEVAREEWQITSRAEWLERRRADLTASPIGALFDCHPYISRQQLADRMRGDSDAGSSMPPDNSAMRRGRIMEPGVAIAIAEERPHWTLTKATTYHRLTEHRLGATPDYFIHSTDPAEPGRGILEIKTAAPQRWEQWRAQLPLAYTLQCLVQMMCCDCAWGYIATMVTSPSLPVHYTAVRRHAAAEERILSATAQWWADFDSGRLAPAAAAEGLAEAFDDGSHRDLSDDNLLPLILPERATLKAQVSAAEKRLKDIDYEIRNRVGPARTAWCQGWNISLATQHRREVLLPARDIRVLRVRASTDDGEESAA